MTYWYLTRGLGAASLVLLTLSVIVGIVHVQRLGVGSPQFPRFLTDSLHRSVSILALVTLVAHVVTTVLDGYTTIDLTDGLIPFTAEYRPIWLGLGTLSADVLIALLLTSYLKARVGVPAWRWVHWSAYGCWALAIVHGLGTGSDVKPGWMVWVTVLCVGLVGVAVLLRARVGWPDPLGPRVAAVAMVVVSTVVLAVWLPSGPLGKNWAKRAGTPSKTAK